MYGVPQTAKISVKRQNKKKTSQGKDDINFLM